VSSRPKAWAWRCGNYITQKGLHLSIVEPMRRRGRDVSVPYRGHFGAGLLAWTSRWLLLSVLGLVPGLRGSQAVSHPSGQKRKHGPHCTEAGLRLGSVTTPVPEWELQSPVRCPCCQPLLALVVASALMGLHRWVLPFPDHHPNPKVPR
jgi:hypothetical protein